jgi:hypothetical protein
VPRENAGVSQRLLIRVAALNNAEWCDAFCRTHGIVGHFRAGYPYGGASAQERQNMH